MNNMMKVVLFLIVSIVLLGQFGCNTKEEFRYPSTIKMADLLQKFADTARVSSAYPYFNDFIIRKYEHLIKGMPYGMQPGRRLDYLLLLLMKGRNEDCIAKIELYLKNTNPQGQVNYKNLPFYKILALAHLRQGEQTNCITNHNQESCVIPLSGGGIHEDKSGVGKATEIYQKLVDFNPNDLQSKWFLNLCYMARGDYGKGELIHEIESSIFDSDTTFKAFENIAMTAGVATNNHAGGSSIEDFNNDGLLDIFTTSYSLGEEVHLYINDGSGFIDMTTAAGLDGIVGGLNNIHADFNNDGNVDIFVTRGAWLGGNGHIPNSLLLNDGQGKFLDATEESGLLNFHPSGTAAAADFNLDGNLDLFIGNESSRDKNLSEIWLNNGDGTFEEISSSLGLKIDTWVKGAVWGDINNDMLPDLYISAYGEKNLLYINRGGESRQNWSFEEIGEDAGVSLPIYSFPTLMNDINNDGFLDIVVFGYDNRNPEKIVETTWSSWVGDNPKGQAPIIYINNGDETFRDASIEMKMTEVVYAMGANFGDIDNDGYPDLYAGTGEFNMWASVPNKMFRNNQGREYQDVTTAGGFGQIQKGHGVSFGDIDNDGDQDIYHQVGGAAEGDIFHNMLFENPGFDNNWISIQLQGVKANRSAIGTKIEVVGLSNGVERSIYKWVSSGGSFGANSLRAEIGLGNMTLVSSLSVTWPDEPKSFQKFTDIKVNQHYLLVQGESIAETSFPKVVFPKGEKTSHHAGLH